MSGIWYGLKLKDIEDVDSNNVRKFITEKTEENGDSFIEIKYLYNEYEKWIVDSDIKEDKIDLQSFVNNGGLDVANGIVLGIEMKDEEHPSFPKKREDDIGYESEVFG